MVNCVVFIFFIWEGAGQSVCKELFSNMKNNESKMAIIQSETMSTTRVVCACVRVCVGKGGGELSQSGRGSSNKRWRARKL